MIPNFRKISIKFKLTFVYTVLFIVAMLILDIGIFLSARIYLYNKADENLQMAEKMVGELLRVGDTTDRYSGLYANDNIYMRVYDDENNHIYSSQGFIYSLEFNPNDLEFKQISTENHDLRTQTFRIPSKDGNVYFLQIVKDMYSENDFLHLITLVMGGMCFLGMGTSAFMGYVFSKRMMQPIVDLTKAAENISSKNLEERIEISGSGDEIQRLAITFNNMIDRLQEAFNKQTQFVSYASHELRTPLAVIHGYINLLDRWGKQDEKTLQESINAIKTEADNMEKLTERLLFLARVDRGVNVLKKRECFLDKLILHSIEEARLIDEKHVYILGGRSEVVVEVDAGMITQLLRIFLDNARKFTPEGGYISVSCWETEDGAKMMVRDTGIGIPEESIHSIFDRFYTVDQSRERSYSGSGLGLAIAEMIVNLHGGKIEVRSEVGVGSEFIVWFPDQKKQERKIQEQQISNHIPID